MGRDGVSVDFYSGCCVRGRRGKLTAVPSTHLRSSVRHLRTQVHLVRIVVHLPNRLISLRTGSGGSSYSFRRDTNLSQSMIQLIIFRAIQGIGGGGILTLSMIIGKAARH